MKNPGQVIILSLIFMLVILIVVGILLGYVFQNVHATRRAVAKEQALQLADAGVDKAVYELNQSAGAYAGESGTALGTGDFDVSVQTISNSIREVTATGYAPNKLSPTATRRVKVRIAISTTQANFFYGVQVGDGGLIMDNNSTVTGNVYSNGPVDGGAGAVITGDAYSAGAAGRIFDRLTINGNAHANRIDTLITVGLSAYGQTLNNASVTGNVFMNSISNCTVGGNAFYTSKTACTISGTETTPYPGEPDPEPQPLPITDQQISGWKTAAQDGGTIVGDYVLSINQQANLGPKKITGKLILGNNSVLTLTGTIWVVGEINISNNATVRLDPGYSNNSEVVISDYKININNNAVFQKAGPNSYIMMLSTSSLPNDAIKVANNADSLIVYAGNGGIEISNNAALREVTGWKIILKNNSVVTYESGLANVNFSGGPGGSWRILRGTWREIK